MQLQSLSARHKCQIDCTNHDEVINALELKSKDLYYFWRNYEWLYNRYYSQLNDPKPAQSPAPSPTPIQKQSHEHCQREIESLQNQNQRLIKQNKRLKMQLQNNKKMNSGDPSDKYEVQYKKEIAMWRSKANQYQQINEKIMSQNGKLKTIVREKEEEFDDEIQKIKRELKKANNTIVQLQQTIDQMRRTHVTVPTGPSAPIVRHEGPSYQEIQEFSRKQVTTVTSRLKYIESQAQKIVVSEFDLLKIEMEDRLAEMLSELTQRELQTVIVSIDQ